MPDPPPKIPGLNFIIVYTIRRGFTTYLDPQADITWLPFPADQEVQAVESGEADILAAWDPFATIAENTGKYNVLVDIRTHPLFKDKACCFIFGSGKLVRDNPGAVAWDYWLSPVIRVTGIIPAVAWLPIALLVFPNSFTTGMFLIFISSWFPVSSMMAAGVIATRKSYFEAAKTLGADNRFLLFHVAIPNAMPSVFTGIMTACAFSFTTLIVSEMVGAKAGLGFYINWAKGWGAYAKVYGAIIIIAVEFALVLLLINVIRRSVLRWQRGIIR